ncbi:MAG: rRNA maturation RNase YbeY [candidate division WOR-3 bacterium]|nr:MAG: rRNA maturation RNase YbeY [candidate division WOR-3 bacterium]
MSRPVCAPLPVMRERINRYHIRRKYNMQIEIYATGESIHGSKGKIERMVRRVLDEEDRKLKTVNIIVADDGYLRDLNRDFLNQDRSTNVISFDLDDVAEIYVSRDHADSEYDLYYYIIHGLLHLLGYDHRNAREEKVMHEKCVKYLRNE